MPTWIRTTCYVLGAVALLSCSDDAASNGDAGGEPDAAADGGTDADTGPTPDAPADTDGGADAAADALPDGGPPPGVLRTSYFNAYSYDFGQVESGQAGAQFFDQDPSPIAISREPVEGGCVFETLELLVEPGQGAFPQYADAGDLGLAGGLDDIVLTRRVEGFYESYSSSARLWNGGETLTFSGSGGADVPAFEAALTAPALVEVTSPAVFTGGGAIGVVRANPLTLSWIPAPAGGQVVVRVSGPEDEESGREQTVECRFEPGLGTGTIPAAALSRLPGGQGLLTVSTVDAREVFTAGWGAVRLSANVSAVTAAGVPYNTAIDLE